MDVDTLTNKIDTIEDAAKNAGINFDEQGRSSFWHFLRDRYGDIDESMATLILTDIQYVLRDYT